MGLFKDLKDLNKQGKEVAKESGRPTGMMGMLKQMPKDIANANETLKNVREGMAESQELQQNGTQAKATIKAVRPTGQLINYNPVAEIDLTVEIAGNDNFDTTTQQSVPQVMLAQLQPGATVPVLIDLTDRTKLMIDWTRAGTV